nr:MAG TPA: hypothetical protein [Caudoviricetes sp.]
MNTCRESPGGCDTAQRGLDGTFSSPPCPAAPFIKKGSANALPNQRPFLGGLTRPGSEYGSRPSRMHCMYSCVFRSSSAFWRWRSGASMASWSSEKNGLR